MLGKRSSLRIGEFSFESLARKVTPLRLTRMKRWGQAEGGGGGAWILDMYLSLKVIGSCEDFEELEFIILVIFD